MNLRTYNFHLQEKHAPFRSLSSSSSPSESVKYGGRPTGGPGGRRSATAGGAFPAEPNRDGVGLSTLDSGLGPAAGTLCTAHVQIAFDYDTVRKHTKQMRRNAHRSCGSCRCHACLRYRLADGQRYGRRIGLACKFDRIILILHRLVFLVIIA
jgi:hypothetical protein